MSGTGATSLRDILNGIASFISDRIMPILLGIAILVFLYNMIYFIWSSSSGNERDRLQFKSYMINSLIAMFILISMWGIVGLGTRTLFGSKPFIPQLPTSQQ